MTTTHRITAGMLAAIALATSAAPASARPFELNTNGSYVQAGASNLTNGQSSTAIRSNPDEQTLTGATTHSTPATAYSRQDKSMVPAASPSRIVATTAKPSASKPVVHVEAPANGFDWGDAGIGAAGGLALSMIGVGGALALSQRRTRRTPA